MVQEAGHRIGEPDRTRGWDPTPCPARTTGTCLLHHPEYRSVPDDDRLLKESTNQFLDKSDAGNRIKLMDKKKIADIIGGSPNSSDATALTFAGGGAEMLSTKEDMSRAGSVEEALDILRRAIEQENEYDPMNYLNKEC